MQHDELEIKKLTVEDTALLSAVATKAYSDHYAHTWEDGGAWYLHTYFSESRLYEELKDRDAWFYMVYLKKEAVGFLKLNINTPLPGEERNAMELERIYLTKTASGKGFGTQLLAFVFELARQNKKEIIWLKVMDTNPGAVYFYQKMGFDICGTHQVDFVQKKEGMRGMYIMRKNL